MLFDSHFQIQANKFHYFDYTLFNINHFWGLIMPNYSMLFILFYHCNHLFLSHFEKQNFKICFSPKRTLKSLISPSLEQSLFDNKLSILLTNLLNDHCSLHSRPLCRGCQMIRISGLEGGWPQGQPLTVFSVFSGTRTTSWCRSSADRDWAAARSTLRVRDSVASRSRDCIDLSRRCCERGPALPAGCPLRWPWLSL